MKRRQYKQRSSLFVHHLPETTEMPASLVSLNFPRPVEDWDSSCAMNFYFDSEISSRCWLRQRGIRSGLLGRKSLLTHSHPSSSSHIFSYSGHYRHHISTSIQDGVFFLIQAASTGLYHLPICYGRSQAILPRSLLKGKSSR